MRFFKDKDSSEKKRGIGRQNIFSEDRINRCKRDIEIEKRQCPRCYHHKAIITKNQVKCAKCKHVYRC